MYLCTQLIGGVLSASEVTTVSSCTGYISDTATNFGLSALTYSDANEIIGAVSLLFAVAFLIRFILAQITNR